MHVCLYVGMYVWRVGGPVPPRGGGGREGRKNLVFISFRFILFLHANVTCHLCSRALARVAIRAYKRRVRTVRRSGGRVIPWTHSNCVGGDVIRGSGQVNRMLRWTSECGEWRRWKVEM